MAQNELARKQLLPLMEPHAQVTGQCTEGIAATDSSAALAAISHGASTTMRYLRKNHRVSLSCLRDYVDECGMQMLKMPSEWNLSDLLTKPLAVDRFEMLRYHMGIRGHKQSIAYSSGWLRVALADARSQRG